MGFDDTAGLTVTGNPFTHLPTMDDPQRDYLAFVIQKTNGKIGGPGGAAEILGMNRTSLYSRMRQLKIDPKELRKRTQPGAA